MKLLWVKTLEGEATKVEGLGMVVVKFKKGRKV